MDCFHDFCLACDKSCVDGAYCSQACRMLDLEKAQMSRSPTTSPRNITHSGWSVSTTSYGQSPAYVPTTSRDSYFTQPSARTYDTSSGRMLSPSSSRTSLSSTTSTTSATMGMTEQARAELSGYFASFDQVRAARRRSSLR